MYWLIQIYYQMLCNVKVIWKQRRIPWNKHSTFVAVIPACKTMGKKCTGRSPKVPTKVLGLLPCEKWLRPRWILMLTTPRHYWVDLSRFRTATRLSVPHVCSGTSPFVRNCFVCPFILDHVEQSPETPHYSRIHEHCLRTYPCTSLWNIKLQHITYFR